VDERRKLVNDMDDQRRAKAAEVLAESRRLLATRDEDRAAFEARRAYNAEHPELVRKVHEPPPRAAAPAPQLTDAERQRQQQTADWLAWETWLQARLDERLAVEREKMIEVVGEALGQMFAKLDRKLADLSGLLEKMRAHDATRPEPLDLPNPLRRVN
jgi:hypothetical protein